MKKKVNIISRLAFAAALSGLVLSGCASEGRSPDNNAQGTASGKLKVMASIYPVCDFAVKAGGDKVTVTDMVPAGTEPHDWEPGTGDIIGLEKADVFVYSGAGMEHWAEDVLKSLDNKSLVVAEASEGITLREGHGEESYDPHVWLDPMNAKKEMENIKNAFVKADPENKDYYENNYKAYGEKFDALNQSYKDALSPFSGKTIVVSHEAFAYLCKAYGLTQMGIEGLTPDSEPDPAQMAKIIDFIKKNKVETIFFEALGTSKVIDVISKETGARAAALNPIEGLSDEEIKAGDDYFSIMEANLEALKRALE